MFKKFLLVLIPIIILAGITGGIGYNKLFRQRIEGAQDTNSKIIGIPKDSGNTTQPTSQATDNSTPIITNNPSKSQNTNAKPVDSNNAQTNTQQASDAAKKVAEQQAQEEAAQQAKIQQCNESNTQRDTVLNPVKQQISDLQSYLINIPSIIAAQIKGTLCNQSCLDNKIQSEQQKTQTQINQLQIQLNQLSSQYPLCTP